MLDNVIIPLIINTLIAGEAIAGITGTPIKQAFQPTRQGVNTQPTAYLYKIGPDHAYGSPRYSDVWDNIQDPPVMVHTETQQYYSRFQLSALATQNPSTPTQYTASDLLNLMRAILQSQVTVASFQANNVGIERIMDIRNGPFDDDRQQFEFNPSFDFIMDHVQIISSTTPIMQSIEINEVVV